MKRFHNCVRRITCPFPRIEPHIPQEGLICNEHSRTRRIN